MSILKNEIKCPLKHFQFDFIIHYFHKIKQYNLNGYLLSFDQGLGKTYTSLALMKVLKKDCVIIIAPKNTLSDVWEKTILKKIRRNKKIWMIGDKIPQDTNINYNYFLINYEAIPKLSNVSHLIHGNIGIIVDEIHNFRYMNTKRTKAILNFKNKINCKDILTLSGTPIKAHPKEMIPMLKLIDPLFDDDALEIFNSINTGRTTEELESIIKNRFGLIMRREVKSQIATELPEKIRKTIKIKIPNGEKYTLKNIKILYDDFCKERREYYKKHFKEYETMFYDSLNYLKNNESFMNLEKENFKRYLKILNKVKKIGLSYDINDEIMWMNEYERETIYPNLTNDLKKKFKKSRAVVKYVELKIIGEAIGILYVRLRNEMYIELLKKGPTVDIIKNAKKKTIIFSVSKKILNEAEKFLKSKNLNPMIITGDLKGSVKEALNEFRNDYSINPLLLSIKKASTGNTITSANTIIFLNKPWRFTDTLQAEDRIYRYEQDEDVYIYTFVLDTGEEPNMSTAMEHVISWTKFKFYTIIGYDEEYKPKIQKNIKKLFDLII